MNKAESKYFHTGRRMEDALISLLGKKDFPYITVKDICAEARVNRSTFYLHYENTADLLGEVIARTNRSFRETFPAEKLNISDTPPEQLFFMTDRYLIPYLDFVKANRRVYRAAHEQAEVFSLENSYGRMFQEIFSPILSHYGVARETHPYMMAYFRHGLAAILMRWVERDCEESPAEIAGIIQLCVGGERR